jgi:hypothetical protein
MARKKLIAVPVDGPPVKCDFCGGDAFPHRIGKVIWYRCAPCKMDMVHIRSGY